MFDSNLSYKHDIKPNLNKVNKTIGLLRKFPVNAPKTFLNSNL